VSGPFTPGNLRFMAASDLRGGIDLGGTKIEAIVVDSANTVRGSARVATPDKGGPQDVTEAMVEAMHKAAEAASTQTSELAGIGVGSPGVVDRQAGTVAGAGNLPGWAGSFPLAAKLEALLGAPVAVGNDVQVATNGELVLGAGQPYGSFLGVFWGTGIGGGVVINRTLWLGRGTMSIRQQNCSAPRGAVRTQRLSGTPPPWTRTSRSSAS
jgi:glucokinase